MKEIEIAKLPIKATKKETSENRIKILCPKIFKNIFYYKNFMFDFQ